MIFLQHNSLIIVIISTFLVADARYNITPSRLLHHNITPSQPLHHNETLISSDGRFSLGFFTPPNSTNRYVGVWYYKITAVQTIVWVANRQLPIQKSNGGTLSITAGGTLTIQDTGWSTNTGGLTRPIALLLNDGNFVLKQDEDDEYYWQSFDYPTDSLLPGMKIGVNLATRHSSTLTSWKSFDDPSPGNYSLGVIGVEGHPELRLSDGSLTRWRGGPWNGIQTIQLVQTEDEVVFSYKQLNDQSVISRIVVTQDGTLQQLTWLEDRKEWILFMSLPASQCDLYGECGPYGVCDIYNSPMCGCLPGFTEVNRDRAIGCARKTALDCASGTDGFVLVREVKLPDTTNNSVDLSLSLDQCRAECLLNCSCTAYASVTVFMGDASRCLIWFTELLDIRLDRLGGQDLYVRLSAVDAGLVHSRKTGTIIAIIGGSISVLLLLLACVAFFLWKIKKPKGMAHGHSNSRTVIGNTMRLILVALVIVCNGCFQRKRKKKNDRFKEEDEENEMDLPIFGFGTIAIATDSFSPENKLGEGGFGPVYKGHLGLSQEIAVKRLAKTSQQGSDEFKNEVMLIAKLQHRNLVRLLGCCIHGEERMLIYEYMPNKSLDAFLFDEEKCALLDWSTRYQIITGITRGLLYLHHDSRLRIIHRDLKASNILLDKEMNPKISDFGMARIFGGDQTDFITRKVVGTYGYMSPEYAMEGKFSMKSDVFSFGVLILEIISGRRNRGAYNFSPYLNLVAHVWRLWNEGKSLQIVHESMKDEAFAAEEALKCIKVGLLCVQERPEDRPLVSSVIVMLGSATDVAALPQPKPPGFIACTSPIEEPKQEQCTSNSLTVSVHGR